MSATVHWLRKTGCLLEGEFTLSSGETSNRYVDCRKALLNAKALSYITYELFEKFKTQLHPDAIICGVPTGGLILASTGGLILASSLLSRIGGGTAYDTRAIYLREKEHKHGAKILIEGELIDTVYIVDDVITTGKSVRRVIDILGQERVSDILTIVDR